jgi:hypothetical protein
MPRLLVMTTLLRQLGRSALFLAALGVVARLHAQQMEVPVATQIALFVKVIAFDRQLQARASGAVTVAIAYQSGHRASNTAREEAEHALVTCEKIGTARVRVVAIDLDSETLSDVLRRERVLILYVAPLQGTDVSEVAAAAQAARVTTLTGVSQYVLRGLAVGVRLQDEKPKLLINIDSAKREGADFSSELLKLAQVVR